jgi:hypothetical protein
LHGTEVAFLGELQFTYFFCMEGAERSEAFELASWKTRLTLCVTPGSYYKVSVKAVTADNFVAARGEMEFKAGKQFLICTLRKYGRRVKYSTTFRHCLAIPMAAIFAQVICCTKKLRASSDL